MSLHTEISSVVPSPITPDIKVGDMGVTLSRLNPMGKIIVGIHTIEARADNELIDEDTPVKIIRIEPTVVISSNWHYCHTRCILLLRTFPFMDFGTSIGGKNLSYPIILDENQKSTATSHCSSYD